MPAEIVFRFMDWVLVFLSQMDEQLHAKLLLLWWHTFHLRSNALFRDGKD
jgi:hypothetical protein